MKKIFVLITKPFDKMLKTPEIDKWCAILCSYRTENYEDFKELNRKVELFEDSLEKQQSELLVI